RPGDPGLRAHGPDLLREPPALHALRAAASRLRGGGDRSREPAAAGPDAVRGANQPGRRVFLVGLRRDLRVRLHLLLGAAALVEDRPFPMAIRDRAAQAMVLDGAAFRGHLRADDALLEAGRASAQAVQDQR